jgi:hypothetical protein
VTFITKKISNQNKNKAKHYAQDFLKERKEMIHKKTNKKNVLDKTNKQNKKTSVPQKN